MALPKRVTEKLEEAFWPLDDILVAMAPDAPAEVMEAWEALAGLLGDEFMVKRHRVRGTDRATAV